VCQEQAVRSLARFRELNPGSEARLGLSEAACDQLHLASRFFKQLIGLEDGGFSFDAKRTQIHAAFCVDSAGKAAAARAQAAREHEAAEARRLAQEMERVAAQQHQQRLLEARETADAVTHEKLEAQAGAARVKLEQAQQRWAATQEAAPEKRRAVQHASLKPDDDGADRAGASTQLSDDAGHDEASGGAGDASGHDGEPAGAPALKAPRRLKRVGVDRHAPEAGDGGPAAVQEGLEDAMEGSPAAKRRATGLSDDDE
jgi:hypothetical protein